MAILLLKEYKKLGVDHDGIKGVPAPLEPGIKNPVNYTVTTVSSAFGNDTYLVELQAIAKVYYEFGEAGTTPVADITSNFLEAGDSIYKCVEPGMVVAAWDGAS